MLNLQQVENGKMLAGLRHYTLIGRDDQQCGIDPADTCQHVLDKIPVTRYVYDANFLAAGQGKPGEAEINGHLTFLLFFKAIGVYTGEGSDER